MAEHASYKVDILLWTKDENNLIFILLGKQNSERWTIPGGLWDIWKDGFTEDEKPDLMQTVVRESWEKVGLSIDHKEYVDYLLERKPLFHNYSLFSYHLPHKLTSARFQKLHDVSWFPITSLPHTHRVCLKSKIALLTKRFS